MNQPKNKLPDPKDLFASDKLAEPKLDDTQSLAILEILKEARKQKISSTLKYRLFIAVMKQETLFEDKTAIACNLTRNLPRLSDYTSDETVTKIAAELAGMFNDTYLALMKDLDNNKALVNKALIEMSKGN